MKRVLFGHRGVGKTSLLKRHATYFREIPHFDLDFEIEKKTKSSITEFFKEYGEHEFRKVETEVFNDLIKKNDNFVIALGAGFDISILNASIEKVFVRRATDKDGRIFLNRPRLDKDLGPLQEYEHRFQIREPIFQQYADRIYEMPEGVSESNILEKVVLSGFFSLVDAFYTLTENEVVSIETLQALYKNIELRTDLLKTETISYLLDKYPQHNWLVSIRTNVRPLNPSKNCDVDINYYFSGCLIVSSHADSIDRGISELSKINEELHLKLCPKIENFSDLIKGYRWQQLDPKNRSFLPRSENAKWKWYRQLAKYFQKMNFVRSFTNSYDQPSVSEWLILPEQRPLNWAALLGEGIQASQSPQIHQRFFAERHTFFTAIPISIDDFKNHFNFLIELGLGFSAITSPLKESALQLANSKSETAEQLKSANTFLIEKSQIQAHNTDLEGFQKLASIIQANESVAVWGGGGTLAMLKSVLPLAEFFSSQTGRLRNGEKASGHYDYLVWAAPRSPSTGWPEDLKFSTLIDLNYSENSPGLEFAARHNIRYINGLQMLKFQAMKQQKFWSQSERE